MLKKSFINLNSEFYRFLFCINVANSDLICYVRKARKNCNFICVYILWCGKRRYAGCNEWKRGRNEKVFRNCLPEWNTICYILVQCTFRWVIIIIPWKTGFVMKMLTANIMKWHLQWNNENAAAETCKNKTSEWKSIISVFCSKIEPSLEYGHLKLIN